MTSNRAGAQSRLICSWMWEAVETVACLACVCVAEVVEGWRRRGYQWATAGVPQSQPFTCCYLIWQAGPQPRTNSLLDISWHCGLLYLLLLYPTEPKLPACCSHCCLSAYLSASIQRTRTTNSRTSCSKCRKVSSLISILNETSYSYFYTIGSEVQLPIFLTLLMFPIPPCITPYHCVFISTWISMSVFVPQSFLFLCMCVLFFSAALWNQLCVFTLPGLPGLSAAAPSLPSLQIPIIARRTACPAKFADTVCTARSL